MGAEEVRPLGKARMRVQVGRSRQVVVTTGKIVLRVGLEVRHRKTIGRLMSRLRVGAMVKYLTPSSSLVIFPTTFPRTRFNTFLVLMARSIGCRSQVNPDRGRLVLTLSSPRLATPRSPLQRCTRSTRLGLDT